MRRNSQNETIVFLEAFALPNCAPVKNRHAICLLLVTIRYNWNTSERLKFLPSCNKTLEEHLQSIKSCGYRWRLLRLREESNKPITLDLPQYRIVPVRCKSKFCAVCRRRNFLQTRHRFSKIDITTKWRFFTLTSKHSPDNSEAELQQLEANFRKLTKHLKRKYPSLKYFAVRELSPSGMWHVHGIWNIFIEIKELSRLWKLYSGAYRCDLQRIRNGKGIVSYIFKYMLKNQFYFEEQKQLYENGFKKFTTSWKFFEKEKFENPYILESSLELTTDELKEKLFEIICNSDCTADDFSFQDYPYSDELIQNLFYEFYCNPDQQGLPFRAVTEDPF